MDKENPKRPQPYTKKNAGSGQASFLQGRAHQLIVQSQMVSPESKHPSNIEQTEQVVFMYSGIYMHIHMQLCVTINEKRG